ncbi:MAG: hypothetical protein M1391_14645 [Bacteroidetes bacterium]|nr:hypothetical protein [Bacteroidota bacterium]
MNIREHGAHIIVSFEGKDYGTGLAKFVNTKIKAMDKDERSWSFLYKGWTMEIKHLAAVKSYVNEFWIEWKKKKKADPREVRIDDYDIETNFLNQFDMKTL